MFIISGKNVACTTNPTPSVKYAIIKTITKGVNIDISNTLEIFPFSFNMSHDNARLDVKSTSSQHVASFVQYGTSNPCLRLSSENYTMIFQGFPNVPDKGTFPSYSALSTSRSNISQREACLQAVYDVALDRYRLC